jgi:capsid assembly protease
MEPDRVSLRAFLLANCGRRWAMEDSTVRGLFQLMASDAMMPVPSREATAELVALSRRAQVSRESGGAVAVIPLRGVITPRPSFLSMLFGGGGGLMAFRDELEQAADDSDITSILLDVDSPGGLVDLVPETAAIIRGVRARKPVVAVANTRAASAGYWLASQADELVVTPSGDVGSVGVYLEHQDWSKANEKEGVAVTYVSAGEFKTEGNPDEPLSEDAQAHLQEIVNESYGMFVSDVAAGRGVSEETVRDGYGKGRVLTAQMALAEGMVDSVETYEQVVRRMLDGGTVKEFGGDEPGEPDAVVDDEEARTVAPELAAVLPAWALAAPHHY